MELIEIKKNKRMVFRAEGFGDLADYATKSARPDESSSKKSSGGDRFYTATTFGKSVDLMVDGWDTHTDTITAIRDAVRQRVGSLDTAVFSFENNLVGQYLDMDAYMQGDPMCMLSALEDTTKRPTKFVRILVDTAFSAGVNAKDIATRGGAILALCDLLNLMGYSTEVWVASGISSSYGEFGDAGGQMVVLMPVQLAGQPWDTRSASYPLACGDFLRRMTFGIMEGMSSVARNTFGVGTGYGFPMASTKGGLADEHCGGADVICQTNVGDIQKILRDPVAWVLAQCQNLGVLSDEEVGAL